MPKPVCDQASHRIRRTTVLTALVLLSCLLAARARAADTSCSSPILISDGTNIYNTLDDDPEGNSTCDPLGTAKTTWWKYTSTCDGELAVSTCGSPIDTVVSAHAAVCPAGIGTELGCNDNCPMPPPGCAASDSCLHLPVFQGQEVLLRVNGANNEDGVYSLNTVCSVPNDRCGDAEPLVAGQTVQGSTRGADWDAAAVCNGFDNTGPGVWYTVVGNGNILEASLCNAATGFDSKISVYCAGCGGQNCITANDDFCGLQSQVSWCSTPGEIYHILVHGYQLAEGTFDLQITDTGTNCGPFYLNCNPANDTCQAAQPFDYSILGDNTSAGTDGSAGCQASAGDVWFERTAVCHGGITYDTCQGGTLADTVLSVQDGCGGTELACNDDAPGCGLRSEVALSVEPGRVHTLRVADYSGDGPDEGTFVLSASQSVPSPVVPWPAFYTFSDRLLRMEPEHKGHMTGTGPITTDNVQGLAWAPGMGLLFGMDNVNARIVAVDPNTGTLFPLAQLPTAPDAYRSLAWDPVQLRLITVHTTSGVVTRIDPFSGTLWGAGVVTRPDVEAVAYDPATDVLYATDRNTLDIGVINLATLAQTWASPPTNLPIRGMTFDTSTGTLYGLGTEPATGIHRIAVLDPAHGLVTPLPHIYLYAEPVGSLTLMEGVPMARIGQPYGATLPFSGGCPPYAISSSSGVPPGLSLDSLGAITGTPTQTGYYLVDYEVEDSQVVFPPVPGQTFMRVAPGNDDCADALSLGDGSTAFTTEGAIMDGPDEPLCNASATDQIYADIWYDYQASCTGNLTVSTCGSGFDTRLAIYDGATCPSGPSALGCDDDGCAPLQSSLTLPVVAGRNLKVRVGGYTRSSGSGTLDVTCVPVGGCCGASGGCSSLEEPACTGGGGGFLGGGSTCSPDSDGDGWNDTCESCPSDPDKIAPLICGCGVPDNDLDGDSIPDCIDPDRDGDLVPDVDDWEPLNHQACRDDDMDSCDDCTSGFYDPSDDGLDTDMDGICDLTDCADSDPNAWSLPGEPEDLSIASDTTSLSWVAPSSPGGQPGGLLYDLVRGGTADDFTVAACLVTDTFFTQEIDTANPAPGGAYYYLVRAINGCGDGGLGVGYPLNPRIGPICP